MHVCFFYFAACMMAEYDGTSEGSIASLFQLSGSECSSSNLVLFLRVSSKIRAMEQISTRFQPGKPQSFRPRGSVAIELGETKFLPCTSSKANAVGSKTTSGGWRNFGKISQVKQTKMDVHALVIKDGSIFAPPKSCCERCLPRMSRCQPYQ